MGFSLFGSSGDKKTYTTQNTQTTTNISTDNRAADQGSIIGGSGDIFVTNTDGGTARAALDLAASSVGSIERFAGESLDSVEQLAGRTTDLAGQAVTQNSVLTAQVINGFQRLFSGATDSIGAASDDLATVTSSLLNSDSANIRGATTRTGFSLAAGVAVVLAIGGFYVYQQSKG